MLLVRFKRRMWFGWKISIRFLLFIPRPLRHWEREQEIYTVYWTTCMLKNDPKGVPCLKKWHQISIRMWSVGIQNTAKLHLDPLAAVFSFHLKPNEILGSPRPPLASACLKMKETTPPFANYVKCQIQNVTAHSALVPHCSQSTWFDPSSVVIHLLGSAATFGALCTAAGMSVCAPRVCVCEREWEKERAR